MRLVGFAVETICGLGFGAEYVDGKWIDEEDDVVYIIIEFLIFRVVIELEEK